MEFHISYTTLLRQLEGYVDDIENSSWVIEAVLQGKLPQEFTKYLYDRYHENFFTETQISDGIQDFVKRYENTGQIESSSGSAPTSLSSPKNQKSSNGPPVAVQHVSVNDKSCIF